jgi:phage terminase large subunit
MGDEVSINLPPKMVDLFNGDARYRGAYGGRGSAKTRSFALMTAIRGYVFGMEGRQGQILCGREHLNSLDESSFQEIKSAIQSEPFLKDYYECGEKFIRSWDGRISYTFSGLRRNIDSIKSKARILLCWVDEAEGVSEEAWQKLVPTVREANSEIWVTWNPENKNSATNKRFRDASSDDMKIVEMNWRDNPFFPAVLERERKEDEEQRPDSYQHIWEGAYKIHVDGAYYQNEFNTAIKEGRIGRVPYDPAASVVTSWDLGVGDSTAIWFAQFVGQEVRIIDYYECSGVGLDHYVRMMREKPYAYSDHILPHDVRVRELGTGKSRLETLGTLGISPITIAPQLRVDDGIQSVRTFLARCWFDEIKCERGIECLTGYRRVYDDKNLTFKGTPLHDWTSHGSDSFRYLATGYKPAKNWGEPLRRNIKGVV